VIDKSAANVHRRVSPRNALEGKNASNAAEL